MRDKKLQRTIIILGLSLCLSACASNAKQTTNQTEELLAEKLYRIPLTETTLETEYFSMNVSEQMIDKISCLCSLEDSVFDYAAFYADSIAEDYVVYEKSESYTTKTGGGLLATIVWVDLSDFQTCSIMEDYQTEDIEQVIAIYNEKYAPVSYEVLATNEDKTGAYCLIEPSDVQWNPEVDGNEETYLEQSEALMESLASFHALKYPVVEYSSTSIDVSFPEYTEQILDELKNGHHTGYFDYEDVLFTFLGKYDNGNWGDYPHLLYPDCSHITENISAEDGVATFDVPCEDGTTLTVSMKKITVGEINGLWQVYRCEIK